ncbi:MAG TPA: trypsin-like peptidase domain-containing protein [Prolixibacteraceae bacterium]|nr:trypsin-like peptidase domain-containing protein [Prolixibacteraceae bacterium]
MKICLTIGRLSIIVFLSLLLFQGEAAGQLSRPGTPIAVEKLKSLVTDDVIVLPKVDNEQLRQASMDGQQQSGLKPFHFAHPFDVALTLANSGQWYDAGQVKVWQLSIRSVDAYSLNVIFGRFHLPEKARLYVIGTKSGLIKGAYTSENNSPSRVLAVEPVAGDELLIQYEEPAEVAFPGELEISRISHDFMGLGAADDHRPLGISGSCNVNINCDMADGTENIRDAVCRIIVEGIDVCTGTLVNNTANDGTPYLLTAYHCIGTNTKATKSVFLFNYESPACATVDGDVSHSLSGSTLRAGFDSLDFALVELTEDIPSDYHHYMAGWNRRSQAPPSSKSIHHPLGDIKKLATDKDVAVVGRYSNQYLNNGFWRIVRWENGTTESGSSGGPLFDHTNLLVGTLTGGSATCSVPTNDFFARFNLAWDYRQEANRQLKAWLDPAGNNTERQEGLRPYKGAELCQPITNFKNGDFHDALQISVGGTRRGYYGGTNTAGFTDFAEQYTIQGSCEVQGVSLGIGRAKVNSASAQSFISVQVHEGSTLPGTLLYSQRFNIGDFYPEAMNYLAFNRPVKTSGNFFISYNVQELHAGDTLAVYLAKRAQDTSNSFFMKNASGWLSYNTQNAQGNGSALLTELIVCDVEGTTVIDSLDKDSGAVFFPNPVTGDADLVVTTKDQIAYPESIVVYDLLGRVQNISYSFRSSNELLLNFSGMRSGVYFIHFVAGGRPIVGKIAYIR